MELDDVTDLSLLWVQQAFNSEAITHLRKNGFTPFS